MAGGSADAAGVLVGLNSLYEARLSTSELCALGAGIGADVPFALMGGTCRVQGVGDFLKALPPCPPCWFVIAMPSVGVSTPEAFARYDQMGSPLHPDLAVQEAAIRAGDLAALCAAAGNALEHCSGAKETPHIRAILDEQGALASPDDRQRCPRCSACSTVRPRPRPPVRPCASSTSRCTWPSPTGAAPGWCSAPANPLGGGPEALARAGGIPADPPPDSSTAKRPCAALPKRLRKPAQGRFYGFVERSFLKSGLAFYCCCR